MTKLYVESSLPFIFSKVNSVLQSGRKSLLVVLSFVIHSAVFADYTIPVGVTTNASTINAQSGTLHIYGTMEVTTNVTFTSLNPIVIILYGAAPGGHMLWSANKTLALPAGSSIIFINNPQGLSGGNSAAAILQIGDVEYAAANDNSNNVLFSFEQINLIGGSASLAPSIALYCFGDPISLLANPVTPPNSTFKVLWTTTSNLGIFSINNSNAAVSTILTNMPLGIDTITTELYVLGGGANYILVARTKIPVDVKAKNTWLGVNTNWNDPINWCPSVPGSTTDVTIPSVANNIYPIFDNYTGSVRNITIASNASVIVNGTGVLQIAGVINNNGIFNTAAGTIEMTGLNTQNIPANTFLNNKLLHLIISSTGSSTGVNLGGELNISGKISFGNVSSKTLFTNGYLTLKSSPAMTAVIADMTNDGANTGNDITGEVTVERYIKSGRKWRLLSVPTNNALQTFRSSWQEYGNPTPNFGFIIGDPAPAPIYSNNGFDVRTFSGPSVKTYDFPTNGWKGIPATTQYISSFGAHPNFLAFIQGDRTITSFPYTSATTIRSKGQLYKGAQQIAIPGITMVAIGNPYASAIDMKKVIIPAGYTDFYVYDPQAGLSTGVGAFQLLTYIDPGFMAIPGGGSYAVPGYSPDHVESGQGFFVQGNGSSIPLTINEDAKTLTAPPLSFTSGMVESIRVNLYLNQSNAIPIVLDGVAVTYQDHYNNAIDGNDIDKIQNTNENIALLSAPGKNLILERRRNVSDNDSIRINMTQMRVQNYQWEIILSNMDYPGRQAYFVDQYKKTSLALDMTGTNLVNFNIENIPGSYAANRFLIVFKQSVAGPLPVTITSIAASRNNDKTVSVLWKVQHELNLTGYEVQRSLDGNTFVSIITQSPDHNNGGAMSYQAIDRGVAEGDLFYRIKANSISGQVQYSAIAKVAALKQNSSISVYPNPVVGGQVHLRFVAQPVGRYQVQLTNAAGQLMANTSIEVSNAVQSENIPLPHKTAGGQYQLRVIKPDGRVYTQQVFVE